MSVAVLFLCIAWLWRKVKTERVWERGLARPLVLDGIQEAIRVHRQRTGKWPAGKSDIRGGVRVDGKILQSVGNWDFKLLNETRGGETARYSIMVKNSWQKWDAQAPAAPVDDLSPGA